MGWRGLISRCCLGTNEAWPMDCCSTMRIIRRSAPDSWSVTMAGELYSREVVLASCSFSGRVDTSHLARSSASASVRGGSALPSLSPSFLSGRKRRGR